MTISAPQKGQLRKAMGFWDVLLFNIATVLGPQPVGSGRGVLFRARRAGDQRAVFALS
jgi:hypothetical protein